MVKETSFTLAKALRLDRLSAILFALLIATGCYAPVRSYPEGPQPTPIYANIPDIVQRGKTYSLTIQIEPDAICHASVLFKNAKDEWTEDRLADTQADQNGVCLWYWSVPQNAKDGDAGIRGYVELKNGEEHNTYPAEFCIETCSEW